MAVLAGVVGGTLFSQLNKQKDNSADTEAKTLANSIKTAIMADTNYQSGNTVLLDIAKEAVTDSEGALVGTKADGSVVTSTTDMAVASAAPTKGTDTTKTAGDHVFVVYVNGDIIYVLCNSVRGSKEAIGYKITYTHSATAVTATVAKAF